MNQLVIKPAFGDIFLQRIQRFLRFGCVFPIVNSRFHEGSPSSRAMPPSACPRHSNRMDDSNARVDALKKENTRSNAANLAALSSAAGGGFWASLVEQPQPFAGRGRYRVARNFFPVARGGPIRPPAPPGRDKRTRTRSPPP